eukprot:3070577-Prymnesium_polylepis.1
MVSALFEEADHDKSQSISLGEANAMMISLAHRKERASSRLSLESDALHTPGDGISLLVHLTGCA